jgi:hypothetical protein
MARSEADAEYPPPTAPWRALVNLTGTQLTVVDPSSGAETVLPPDGFAKVAAGRTCGVGTLGGVALLADATPPTVRGIPPYDPAGGVLYIVTALAAAALHGRPDVARPGEARRSGRVVTGCYGIVLCVHA